MTFNSIDLSVTVPDLSIYHFFNFNQYQSGAYNLGCFFFFSLLKSQATNGSSLSNRALATHSSELYGKETSQRKVQTTC